MKIDLTSPIVPGVSAGNVPLGTDIETVLADNDIEFKRQARRTTTIYMSDHIDFCVDETGKIYSIIVQGQYLGKIEGKVGIGSTYEDVETYLGRVGEDIDDNMVVKEFPGFGFEHNPDGLPRRLTHICVFIPEDTSDWPDGAAGIRY
jgi:hypothetical protein